MLYNIYFRYDKKLEFSFIMKLIVLYKHNTLTSNLSKRVVIKISNYENHIINRMTFLTN